jgi:hypothetical protein
MSDQSLFNNENPQQQQSADQPQTLFTIGDRAYDIDSARTKIENADQFINTLKGEKQDMQTQRDAAMQQNAQLAAQLEQSTKLDEALSMFANQQQQQPTDVSQAQQEQTPSFDVEALKAALKQEVMNDINAQNTAKLENTNMKQSMEAAQKAFGADVATRLQERGAQLGMSPQAIDQLAKTQPQVFNELFIPKAPTGGASPDGRYSQGAEKSANLNDVIADWGDRDKFWSSQSKAESLRAMTEEVGKLIEEGKINPYEKNFF